MASSGQGVVAVACSGGRDSLALLHATLRSARDLGLSVVALHVHHGLQAQADDWLRHLQRLAARWRRRGWPLTLHWQRLAGHPAAGQSVEAWARLGRYAALAAMARRAGAGIVLLGHHRRDQAETLLLQALRGAGPAGLAAMPVSVERDGLVWARPWLDQPRAAIDAYVRGHRLRPLEDPSNQDPALARNRLRLQVWPALEAAFSGAEAALAGAARRAHEADTALAELAAMDLARVSGERGLNTPAWKTLGPARRSNALRAWLRRETGRAATPSLASRLLAELPEARSAGWPCHDGALRHYRGVLTYRRTQVLPDASQREVWLCVRRCGVYKLPGWAGQVHVRRTTQGGVLLAWLGQIELRARSGGEQFQAGAGRPPRSLKKQYQAASLAPWCREGPLFFSGGQLVFAPGLGVDARVWALPGQPQVTLEWQSLADPEDDRHEGAD